MSKIIHTSGSDHISSDLLADGPETFTITDVIEVELEEGKTRHAVCLAEANGKSWIPAFTIIKALSREEVWGKSISNWRGQRITLYRDPEVRIGKQVVGGIRVSHVTGIDQPKKVQVRGAQNRPVSYTFQPLTASEPAPESITAEQWQAIVSAAREKGMDAQAVAAEVAGRELSSPRELTGAEAERIMGRINGDA